LEDLGWKIYRIWSKDWFYNTSYEIQKLLAYIKDNTRVAPEEEYYRDHLDIDTTEQVEESGLIEEDSIPEHVSELGYKKDLSRTVELYDTVTFKRTDTDEERTLKIVEGNGDISKGTISVNAALAAALLSRELGEEVEINDYSIVILKILKA
jgi:transcription elongation GreA/GreB family factor